MKNILIIDTSDCMLKLALRYEDTSFFHNEDNTQKQIEILVPRIKRLFEQAQADIKSLNEIYVCCGPGSFTGLRIGITTAISLAYSLDIPVYGFCAFAVYDYLVPSRQILVPIVDGKKHQFYCTFITQHFDGESLYDLTYEDLKNKMISYNKKCTVCGKDSSLVKDFLSEQNVDCEFVYEDGYKCGDMLDYITSLGDNHNLKYPEPIYIRKSEAEIELLNRKNSNN